MDHYQRLANKQAEIISALNDNRRAYEKRIAELEGEIREYKCAGKFYLELQREIIANPILQSEWTRFCSFLKMALPDAEQYATDYNNYEA